MENIENTSVEMTEVAEPSAEDVSVETQEVAEPVSEQEEVITNEETEKSGKTDTDSAFAEMRRKLEQAERENQQMIEALSLYFDGENGNDLSVQAMAHAQQRDPADIQAELDRQREYETLKAENETLKQQAQDLEVQRAINESLKILNNLDPEIKTVDDIDKLGDSFLDLIGAGVDTETAFYAVQAKNYKNKVNAPTPAGKINSVTAERDYYTSDELDNLSKAEIRANWEKVQRSMSLLK
jgi:hypothetical protein